MTALYAAVKKNFAGMNKLLPASDNIYSSTGAYITFKGDS